MSSNLPPNLRPTVDSSSINGRLTDRALDMINQLNQVIGFEGTGSRSYKFVEEGTLTESVLAIHNLGRDADDPSWKENQIVFFQASPQKLDHIQAELMDNITRIQQDMIGNLYRLIEEKATTGGLDALEGGVDSAGSIDETLAAGSSLEDRIRALFTDSADTNGNGIADPIDTIMNDFVTEFTNLISRIQEEVINLFDDGDDTFSGTDAEGDSTDTARFFVDAPGRDKDNTHVRNRIIEQLKIDFAGSVTDFELNAYIENQFDSGQIELSRNFLNEIKSFYSLSDEDVAGFNQDDYLNHIKENGGFNDFIEIAKEEYRITTGSPEDQTNEALERIFADHVDAYEFPAQTVTLENLLAAELDIIKLVHEDRGSSYNPDTTVTIDGQTHNFDNDVVKTVYENLFGQQRLRMEDDFIQHLIDTGFISTEQAEAAQNSRDFLSLFGSANQLKNKAIEFYGFTDDADGNASDKALLKLIQGHSSKTRPVYFQDQRTIKDILRGKATSNSDISNTSKIFGSVHDQVMSVGNSAFDLFSTGFERGPTSPFQAFLRDNPVAAIKYLQDIDRSSLSSSQRDLLDQNTNKLAKLANLAIKREIEFLNNDIAELEGEDPVDTASITNKQAEISRLTDAVETLNGFNGSDRQVDRLVDLLIDDASDDSKFYSQVDFAAVFNDLEIDTSLSAEDQLGAKVDIVNQELEADLVFQNITKSLYANELLEASRINAQYQGRKLPGPRLDGSLPEDTRPIPPQIGPTVLSAVIARIGDVILEKSRDLSQSSNIPTESWLDDKIADLHSFNTGLTKINDNAAGEKDAFAQHLADLFAGTLENFINDQNGLKTLADSAKTNLSNFKTEKTSILSDIDQLTGSFPSAGSIEGNLNSLEGILGIGGPSGVADATGHMQTKGLENIKNYLEDLITDDVDLDGDGFGDSHGTDAAQRARAQDLLNTPTASLGGESIAARLARLTSELNTRLNPSSGQSYTEALAEEESTLIDDYKVKIKNYSDALTDTFETEAAEEIEEAFKDVELEVEDPDNPGSYLTVNMFDELERVTNTIEGLSEEVENIFGSPDAENGGIEDQSMRRLLLILFFFTITEAGDWLFARDEADVSRYQVS